MAGTITTQFHIGVSNPPCSPQETVAAQFDQANRGQIVQKYALAADHSAATIAFTGLTVPGIGWLQNLGGDTDADELLVGPVDGAGGIRPAWRILKGETWPARFVPGATYKAQTGAGESVAGVLSIWVNEN